MDIFHLLKLFYLRKTFSKHEKWSRLQLMEYQGKKLAELRQFAYVRSPFYQQFHQGLMNRPLTELPVLTKGLLMEHWNDIVTDRTITLKEVEQFLPTLKEKERFKDKYNVVSTSGSTGLKGIFIYNAQEWMQILASYARANDWAGLKVGLTKRLKIAVVSSRTPWHQSSLVGATIKSPIVPTLRIDSVEPMEQIVEKLNHYHPQSLIAYANMGRLLAIQQLGGTLHIHPQAIFCASEVLTQDSRSIIEKAWNTKPFNVYAATETAGIASERTDHRGMYVYEDFVIAEPVDEKYRPVPLGEFAPKILVTVLFSRTLPLIRYEMSDSVCFAREQFADNFPFARMEEIQGRMEEIITLTTDSGKQTLLQPNFFHKLMENLPVANWQIEQIGSNALKILIIDPSSSFNENELIEKYTHALTAFGITHTSIAIEYSATLSRNTLGKILLIKALKSSPISKY